MDELITVLEEVFGSPARRDDRGIHAVIRSDGAFVPARIRTTPVAELFVTTRALDGFTLSIKWADRDPATFESAFSIDTNDQPLADLFLDATSRHALLDSIYEYQSEDVSLSEAIGIPKGAFGWRPPATAKRAWTYELASNEIAATKGGIEHQSDKITRALTCACALAARSTRWAGEYAVLARELGGGSTRSEVDLGGPPVFTLARNAVDVSLRVLRTLPDAKAHLRTAISAQRVSPDASSICVYDAELPKSARPPLPAGGKRSIALAGYKLRASEAEPALVDELAIKLIGIAKPAAAIVDADSADVWFDGAPLDRERIDAAIELAARWAVGTVALSGPYR